MELAQLEWWYFRYTTVCRLLLPIYLLNVTSRNSILSYFTHDKCNVINPEKEIIEHPEAQCYQNMTFWQGPYLCAINRDWHVVCISNISKPWNVSKYKIWYLGKLVIAQYEKLQIAHCSINNVMQHWWNTPLILLHWRMLVVRIALFNILPWQKIIVRPANFFFSFFWHVLFWLIIFRHCFLF